MGFILTCMALAVALYLAGVGLTAALHLPAFFAHWAWWLSVFVTISGGYVEAIRSQLATQTKNLRWLEPSLRPVIFGSVLGFLGKHSYWFWLVSIAGLWYGFGWLAAVCYLGAVVLMGVALYPLAVRHARQILAEPGVVGNEALQEFLRS